MTASHCTIVVLSPMPKTHPTYFFVIMIRK
ncbi:hypothetical protein CFP56_027635 [Quercus suber]|uniref:Uncharacterized protein n=1 Tax=Quercus suber TaxID=58331 RepID=A0AAW0JXF3_QUESU